MAKTKLSKKVPKKAKKKTRLKAKGKSKGKSKFLFIIISIFVAVLSAFYLYVNYNFAGIIQSRINSIYSQSEISKYYSLDYKKLKINPFTMSISIYNAKFSPLKNAHKKYFKKNGHIDVKIGAIILSQANIIHLLTNNTIDVNKVKFRNVNVYLEKTKTFSPFRFIKKKGGNDSLILSVNVKSFVLKKASFVMNDLSNKITNSSFDKLDIRIDDFNFSKNANDFNLSVSNIQTKLDGVYFSKKNGTSVKIKELLFDISKINILKNNEGFNYTFDKNLIKIKNPSIITADGIYKVSSKSIVYNAKNKSLALVRTSIKPIISRKLFIEKTQYQEQLFDIEIQNINAEGVDYDEFKQNGAIIANKVILNKAEVVLFKDKHKKINPKRFPNYLPQQILAIKLPIKIKSLEFNKANVYVNIIQEDGKKSAIEVNNMSLVVGNIQNKYRNQKLKIRAKGEVQEAIPFSINLSMNYNSNYFKFSGRVANSNIVDLAKPIASFAPVIIHNGRINSMTFSGTATKRASKGNMSFAYSDLNIEVNRHIKGKNTIFADHLLTIAASSVVKANNPSGPNVPLRKVKFKVERDIHKGFVNIIIKSVLAGVKESILPSKENRKLYRKVKSKRKH